MPGAQAKAEVITILPLTGQLNPYLKDYDPWDKWIYEHAVTSTDPGLERYFRGEGASANTVLDAYVDSSGFLVPLRVAEQRRLHAQATGHDDQPVYLPNWTHVLFAAGRIDPALLDSYQQAMLALRSQYTVTIPDWLAANPPAWSLVLPQEAGAHAGEVVMYGRPGLDPGYTLPPGESRPSCSREVFYRYGANGKVLGQTKVGQQWWELYTTNPATPEGTGSSSVYRVFEAIGVISVTDVRTDRRAWLMDFTGKHLPDEAHPAPRNANHWLGLTARELKAIHAFQHRLPAAAEPPARKRPKSISPPLGGAKH